MHYDVITQVHWNRQTSRAWGIADVNLFGCRPAIWDLRAERVDRRKRLYSSPSEHHRHTNIATLWDG